MRPKYAAKFPLIVAITLSSVALAPAANFYWDGGVANIGTNGDGISQGGNGTWNTTITNWDQGNALAHVAWSGTTNSAVFGGAAGTVDLGVAVTNAATTFNTAGYTLNLSNATAATAYTLGTLTGAPTINVTLVPPSSSAVTTNSTTAAFGTGTSFAGFTGILNIGTASQTAVSGKAQINSTAGALPAGATVNVRSNSTLYANSPLTHLAPITLNGGDTGEVNGQLRLDSGANWGGSVTLAGDITTTNDAIVGTGTGTGTISGNIGESGTRTLSKGSTGTLILSGTNSFTGGTMVRAGTLTLDYTTNNTNKIATAGPVTLSTSSTLRFTGNAAAATTQGANGLTLVGTGSTIALDTAAGQTLTADLSGGGSGVFTGSAFGLFITTSGTGTPQLKLPGTTPNSPLPGVIYNNTSYAATDASNFVVPVGTLNTSANDLATWTTGPTQYATTGVDFINQVGSGVVIDGITFSDAGARTVTIGTGNTLTLNRGVIVASTVGNNLSKITGGSIQGPSGGALNITNFDGNNQLSIASTIVNNGGTSLIKMGTGALELTAANSYTGGTIVDGGIIKLGNIGALGSGPVTFLATPATTALNTTSLTGSQNFTNNIVINNFPVAASVGMSSAPGPADVMELSGVISGGNATTTLFFNANAVTTNTGVKFIISGNNSTYIGNVRFDDGGVRLNHPNGFGTGGLVSMFQSSDTALVFGSSMTVSNPITQFGGTKRIDTGAFDVVLSGIQTFTAPTTKTGTGKLTLTAVNAGTANLTVGAGTLALGAGGSLLNNLVTVAGGAVFDTSAVGGFNIATGQTLVAGDTNAAADVVGNLSLIGGINPAVINPAGDTAAGTLTVDGNLTLNGGTLRFSDVGDQIALTGASRTLTLSGTNTINGPLGFLAPGTYTLVSGYTSVAGTGAFAYNASVVRGGTSSINVGATATTLTVNNTVPLNLTWSGTTGGLWDVNTTANWNTGSEKFYQNDLVTFTNAPVNPTVTINGTVTPGSIAFTNASTAYTMRGGATPVIAGTGAMTKTGGAQLTLWHPSNTYSGGTTISAGTLALNNAANVPTGTYTPLGTGLITINTGGTLQVNPSNGGSNISTFPNALRLNGGTLFQDDGSTVFSGVTTVDAASFIKTQWSGKNLTLAGGLAGSGNLTISDQNTGQGAIVFLNADGSYSGNLTINNILGGANGAVQLNTANALQNATVTVNTTAALDGTDLRGLILAGTGLNITIAGLSGTPSGATIHNANDTNTRTLTVNQSTTTTFAGSIGGTSASPNTQHLNLVKSGAGTLTLTGANTYTGNTTVNGGTLAMPTRTINGGNSDVTVADGATLGVISTGVSLLINNLNLGTSGANTLAITNYTPSTTAVINALVLNKNATTTISLNGTLSTSPQTYPLIAYQTKTGAGTFVLAPLPRGVVGALVDSGTSIDLNITAFDNLVWKGTAGNTWDLNTTSNWKLGALDPATYVNGDNVVFDGSAVNNTVNLTATVAPASLTFDFDSPKAYTVGGTGAITGATGLIKKGTGTLTLGTANSYNGITSVTAGSVVLGNASALGSAVGGTTVADGTTLELNGYSTGGETYTLDGSLLNNGAVASTLGGAVTLSGDVTIGGTGNIAINGSVSGSGPLLKTGPNTLLLGAAGTYSGGTTVNSGTLQLGSNNALGTGVTTVNSGATLDLNGKTAGPVTLNGSTIANSSPSSDGRFGDLTLNGGGTLASASAGYFGLPGSITGSGDLIIAGNAWAATSPYTINMAGKMVVNSGNIDTYSQISFGANVTGLVLNGGSFNVNNSPSQTVPSLSGSATGKIALSFNGPLVINQTEDGTFAGIISGAGNPVVKNGPATLTLSGTNTYAGNTTVNAGTLQLSATGRLTFFLGATSGTSNTLSGAGTATLNGGFSINTTAADSLTTGTWNLETMGASSTYGSGFKVYQADGTTAWTDAGGDKWTKTGTGGRIWTFNEATGTLTLVIDAYTAWASQITDPAQRGSDKDPDGDGLTNLQEFLFGKNPNVSDGTLVNTTVSGSDLVLRWLQRETGSTYTLKESSTLDAGSWTTSAITPLSDVQPGDPTDYDQWKAIIPQGTGKKFFRIEGVNNN